MISKPYVAGVSVKTDEKTSAEEAQNAVQDAALAQAKASGATGVYNVKTTDTDTIAHTSYSYEIDYLEKTGETTTNTAVRTETYANAEVLTGQIIQNLNSNGSTFLLVEQNAQMALSVAHRGYVLETGRVVTTGTGEELIESPEIKKAYLGG